jgi:hypothetical protein
MDLPGLPASDLDSCCFFKEWPARVELFLALSGQTVTQLRKVVQAENCALKSRGQPISPESTMTTTCYRMGLLAVDYSLEGFLSRELTFTSMPKENVLSTSYALRLYPALKSSERVRL